MTLLHKKQENGMFVSPEGLCSVLVVQKWSWYFRSTVIPCQYLLYLPMFLLISSISIFEVIPLGSSSKNTLVTVTKSWCSPTRIKAFSLLWSWSTNKSLHMVIWFKLHYSPLTANIRDPHYGVLKHCGFYFCKIMVYCSASRSFFYRLWFFQLSLKLCHISINEKMNFAFKGYPW